MIPLYNYVNNFPRHRIIDAHVHMFNKDGVLEYPHKDIDGIVVMVENSIKHTDNQLFPLYEQCVGKINIPHYLLCVGCDRVDTYNIYKKYSDRFSGFGEIKCYKHCIDTRGNILEHFDTNILTSVFELGVNKPIFIHWDLNGKHDDEFEKILKNYPTAKIVLCHCGINDMDSQYNAFKKACELQTKYTNLWLSISWVALDYFYEHMNQLSYIPIPDHTIVGTDFNPEMSNSGIDEDDRYDKFKKIYDRFDTPVALNNLFKTNKTLLDRS